MTKENIVVLNERQKARDKISVWFGSADNFYHPIRESLANAIDEISNNFDSGQVKVILHSDNKTITVSDTGRGIPIDGKTGGVDNSVLLFETTFAGTKYENDKGKFNTGTHGVGNTIINYTSELFEVSSSYNGVEHNLSYTEGGLNKKYSEKKANKSSHGSSFTFKLDDGVYTKTEFDGELVKEIVKHVSVTSPKITFLYEGPNDDSAKYHYSSINEYFDEQIGNSSTSGVFSLPSKDYEDEIEKNVYEVIFTTTPDAVQESYLNSTWLSDGGTVPNGVLDAIRLFGNKYAKDNKLFDKAMTSFSKEDVSSSISFIANVRSTKVEFTNQTKLSTEKKVYQNQIKQYVTDILNVALIEQPNEINKMYRHIIEVQKSNVNNEKAKKKLKKKLSEKIDGINNRVDKLVDSKEHGLESELFISEGLSAMGSVIQARDAKHQAAYPLRGKILNVMKANWNTIFDNEVIMDLIKTLGTGISADKKNKDYQSFDMSKARFGKVMIAVDADSDGLQIAALIITMFYKLMKPMLDEGRLYLVKTPLYIVKLNDDSVIYYHSEDEKSKKFPKLTGVRSIARLKGLGEVDSETMAETAMNPVTRDIVQVTTKNMSDLDRVIETWMGSAVDGRKDEISKRLPDFVELAD